MGDPAGAPVLYLHGTPDCRLARHPDDHLAAAAGVRLLAVDRPGCGRSTPHDAGTVGSFADDLTVLADRLGIDRGAVLAWSGGAVYAVGLAARLAATGRITAVGIAAGLVPFEAYREPDVAEAVAESRGWFVEAARELPPGDLAREVAPMLIPYPLTLEAARDHVAEVAGPARLAEYEAVPGSAEQMAEALVETVQGGLAGVEHDLRLQATTLDVDLAAVDAPVYLWYGDQDHTCPPTMGRWYERTLQDAHLEVLPAAGHGLALTNWREMLATLVAAEATRS